MRVAGTVGLRLLLLCLCAPGALAAEVHVVAANAPIRTAPFDVAPSLGRVHAGDRLTGEPDAQSGWLRVALPDGRHGFLRASDARVTAPPPPPPPPAAVAAVPPPPQPRPPPRPQPKAVVLSPEPSPVRGGPVLVGVAFEVLPAGRFRTGSPAGDSTADADVTTAVAPFLDVPFSPWFELGLSPQIVFKVKGSGANQSATAYDVRARLTARYPASPRTHLFVRLSPGFSYLSLPYALPPDASSPSGFVLDASAGTEVALLPSTVLVVELGYQLGFQTASASGVTVDENFDFLHLGVGLALGL
jgi:hypothetical protein